MDWKRAFFFDLRRLIPGARIPAPEEGQASEFFFAKLFRRGSKVPKRPTEYTPGTYYRRLTTSRWRGPFYLRAARWRRDLLDVCEVLTATVRANASLTQGLEAAAQEENRLFSQMRSARFSRIALSAALGALILIPNMLVAFDSGLFDHFDAVALSVLLVVLFTATLPALLLLSRGGIKEAVFLHLRDRIAAGIPLSEAMRQLSSFFPSFYADMAEAGESSGKLEDCLRELSRDTQHRISLARQVFGNVVYLSMVCFIQLFILSFLLVKVIPVFAEILQEFGSPMPWPTRALINTGDFVATLPMTSVGKLAMVLAAAALLVTLILLRVRRRKNATARPLSAVFLAIPVLRGLLVRQNLASVAMMLDKLLGAGIPLDEAVGNVSRAAINPLYQKAMARIQTKVAQGETFTSACESVRGIVPIPNSFVSMVSIGERSGMLPAALREIGAFYQATAARRARMLSDAIMPFGVLALGALALWVEVALFTTLTSVTSAVSPW